MHTLASSTRVLSWSYVCILGLEYSYGGVTRIQGLCTLHLHTLHTLLVGDFNTVRLYEFSSQYSTQLMIILIILLYSRVCIIILLLGVRARIMHNIINILLEYDS